MTTATIAGANVQIDDEGFLTDSTEWTEEIGKQLAENIGIELTDRHWEMIRFIRDDYAANGVTPGTRRVQASGGFTTKEQFTLFPKKPQKKSAYIAGVPKPAGCV